MQFVHLIHAFTISTMAHPCQPSFGLCVMIPLSTSLAAFFFFFASCLFPADYQREMKYAGPLLEDLESELWLQRRGL